MGARPADRRKNSVPQEMRPFRFPSRPSSLAPVQHRPLRCPDDGLANDNGHDIGLRRSATFRGCRNALRAHVRSVISNPHLPGGTLDEKCALEALQGKRADKPRLWPETCPPLW